MKNLKQIDFYFMMILLEPKEHQRTVRMKVEHPVNDAVSSVRASLWRRVHQACIKQRQDHPAFDR